MSKLTEQINSAPELLKSYIHDLVSGYGKSAEMVQDNIVLKDTAEAEKKRADEAESERDELHNGLVAVLSTRAQFDAEDTETLPHYVGKILDQRDENAAIAARLIEKSKYIKGILHLGCRQCWDASFAIDEALSTAASIDRWFKEELAKVSQRIGEWASGESDKPWCTDPKQQEAAKATFLRVLGYCMKQATVLLGEESDEDRRKESERQRAEDLADSQAATKPELRGEVK